MAVTRRESKLCFARLLRQEGNDDVLASEINIFDGCSLGRLHLPAPGAQLSNSLKKVSARSLHIAQAPSGAQIERLSSATRTPLNHLVWMVEAEGGTRVLDNPGDSALLPHGGALVLEERLRQSASEAWNVESRATWQLDVFPEPKQRPATVLVDSGAPASASAALASAAQLQASQSWGGASQAGVAVTQPMAEAPPLSMTQPISAARPVSMAPPPPMTSKRPAPAPSSQAAEPEPKRPRHDWAAAAASAALKAPLDWKPVELAGYTHVKLAEALPDEEAARERTCSRIVEQCIRVTALVRRGVEGALAALDVPEFGVREELQDAFEGVVALARASQGGAGQSKSQTLALPGPEEASQASVPLVLALPAPPPPASAAGPSLSQAPQAPIVLSLPPPSPPPLFSPPRAPAADAPEAVTPAAGGPAGRAAASPPVLVPLREEDREGTSPQGPPKTSESEKQQVPPYPAANVEASDMAPAAPAAPAAAAAPAAEVSAAAPGPAVAEVPPAAPAPEAPAQAPEPPAQPASGFLPDEPRFPPEVGTEATRGASWVLQHVDAALRSGAMGDARVHAFRMQAEQLRALADAAAKPVIAGVVGISGAGKSSCLNAVLGEGAVLPTSGVHACTASKIFMTRTEPAANEQCPFSAEVRFIDEGKWKKRVLALLDALRDEAGRLDVRRAGQEVKKERQAVLAVYGRIAEWDELCKLPSWRKVQREIRQPKRATARLAARLQPWVQSYTEAPLDRAGRLKRGGAQLWPLVEEVHLAGPFRGLAPGVCLVDLPGVEDQNAARVQVTLDFMKKCSLLLVVSALHRASDEKTAWDVLGSTFRRQVLMDGACDGLAFVGTKADQGEASELRRNLRMDGGGGGEEEEDEGAEGEEEEEEGQDGDEEMGEAGQGEAPIDLDSEGDGGEDGAGPSESHAAAARDSTVFKERNATVKREIQRGFGEFLDEFFGDVQGAARPAALRDAAALPVFTVASHDFAKLTGRMRGKPTAFSALEETEIPALRAFVAERAGLLRKKAQLRLTWGCTALAEALRGYLADPAAREASASGRAQLKAAYEELAAISRGQMEKSVDGHVAGLRKVVEERLRPAVEQGRAEAAAKCPRAATDWSRNVCTHWASYRATMRRDGVWRQNVNELLSEPFSGPVARVWGELFERALPQAAEGVKADLLRHATALVRSVAAAAAQCNFDAGRLAGQEQAVLRAARTALGASLDEMAADVRDLQGRGAGIAQDAVCSNLSDTYSAAAADRGTGVFARMRAAFEGRACRHCPTEAFKDASDKFDLLFGEVLAAFRAKSLRAGRAAVRAAEPYFASLWEQQPVNSKALTNARECAGDAVAAARRVHDLVVLVSGGTATASGRGGPEAGPSAPVAGPSSGAPAPQRAPAPAPRRAEPEVIEISSDEEGEPRAAQGRLALPIVHPEPPQPAPAEEEEDEEDGDEEEEEEGDEEQEEEEDDGYMCNCGCAGDGYMCERNRRRGSSDDEEESGGEDGSDSSTSS
eukprot:tig00000147_g9480.t1